MRAAVYRRYGPPEVVRIEEVPRPVPKANEVLVKVHAATVCAADWRVRKADPFIVRLMNGLGRPRKTLILGMECSGVVEEAGSAVTRFEPGQAVFGSPLFRLGAHAEYVCIPEDGALAAKPDVMSFEEAAAVMFGGLTTLAYQRAVEIRPGQKVLVNGACGSVGVFAVQIFKRLGAHVTGVCSTGKLETVRSIGADEVIDYTRQDFVAAGPVYDLVFETVGKGGFRRGLKALRRGGTYVTCAPMPLVMLAGGLVGALSGRRVVVFPSGGAGDQRAQAEQLQRMIEAGEVRTVIDRVFPFEEIVEAHRLAESGHKRGHAVVKIV